MLARAMFDLDLPRLPLGPLALLGYAGLCAAGVLAALGVDQVLRLRQAVRDARARGPTRPYQYRAVRARKRVLIVGDSTGVGVGADRPTDSIGGLLTAAYGDAELVNLAVGGACIGDVAAQLRRLGPQPPRFDLVLLHVGGNDIMRNAKLPVIAQTAEPLMLRLRHLAPRVVWLGPGDLGLAPLFRPPFSWWLSRRTEAAAEMFRCVALRHDVEYVGFHAPPHRHLVAGERTRYFASDGLHPSSHAYRYAYGCLMRSRTVAEALNRER